LRRRKRRSSRAFLNARLEEFQGERKMSTILLIVLVLLLLGALPTWPHSSSWGYYPSGGLGLILIIVVVLIATGRM
jgi:hypothetical protein